MMNIKMKLLPLAISSLGLLASSTQLSAAEESNLFLEEIIVTAQKRAQSMQDVPVSVAAVSGDDLGMSNTNNFADLGKIASGVSVSSDGGGFFPSIRIRGVGSDRFTPGISSSVTIFTNDIPMIRAESAFNNLSDISRIEILKGPQSTLFGKSVSSGAFSIYTNAPDPEQLEGSVEANVGDNNLQEYRGMLNLPLAEGYALRGTAYTTQHEGEVVNLITDRSEDGATYGGRLDLLIEPSDNFSAIVGYEKHKKDVNDMLQESGDYGSLSLAAAAASGVTLPDADPYDNSTYTLTPGFVHSGSEMWSLRASYDFNDEWALSSVSSKQFFDSSANVSSASPLDTILGLSVVEVESLTQELRATYSGDRLSSVFGLFYSDSDRLASTDLAIGVFPTGLAAPDHVGYLSRTNDGDSNTEDMAFFSHNILTLTDTLDLTFGLRYQEVSKTSTDGAKYGQGAQAGLQHPAFITNDYDIPTQTDTWEAITGSLKLSYSPGSDVSYYAGFDRGFKAGGFNTVQPANVIGGADATAFELRPAFDSQTADNFELGVKSELFERRLRLNASLFYQTYGDYQVIAFDAVDPTKSFVQNAGELETTGLEADFMWLVNESLVIDGTAAVIDAQWGSFEDAPCNAQQLQVSGATCSQDLTGKDFNGNSKYTANLNATWRQELSQDMEWFVRAEAAFKSSSIGTVEHDERTVTEAYTLFNASAGINTPSWNLSLWAKNLTDEQYTTLFTQARDGSGAQPGSYGILHNNGQGRTFGLKAKHSF